jgi:uncharacterized protein
MLQKIQSEVQKIMQGNDPAHDFEHIMRVYSNTKIIAQKEKANKKLVLSSVLLHDIVVYPKSDKRSKTSSKKSSIKAQKIMQKYGFSNEEINIVSDAINTHSFSKNQSPKTLVGKILQDADRLDALGAIGIARVFATGGSEKRSFYNTIDPFCKRHSPNDQKWTLDHFYKKLLILENRMHTKSAKKEAKRRTRILKKYLELLKKEL